MKTPLKSPSIELKSVATLLKLIPPQSLVHTGLLYDGKLEIELASNNRFVVAHTTKYVIYEFWRCLREDPRRVAAFAEHMHPIEDKNIFYLLQENWPKYADPFVRAGLFLMLNRYSDTGLVSRGAMDIDNYSPLAILNLKSAIMPPNFHLFLDDEGPFLPCFEKIQDDCDYLVIPAGRHQMNLLEKDTKSTFEETMIDHEEVHKFFSNTTHKTLVVYEYSPSIAKMYQQYNQYIVDKWGRQTETNKFAEELIIANF
jgi:hypothetical protein